MASPSKNQRHLQPLTAHWNNQNGSRPSITSNSDAASFHSARDHASHMELQVLTQTASHPTQSRSPSQTLVSQNLSSVKMSRQDPGYSGTSTGQSPLSAPSPRRTSLSTSSTRRSSPSKLKRWAHTSTYSASRPSTKRTTQSSPQTALIRQSSSGRRPSFQARHTTPCRYSHPPTTYQFFQLPSLADNEQPEQNSDTIASPPPPATVQYWTSDSTRRLEYAAIDAASRGVRGFLVKIVPDCILQKTSRSKERSQFWKGNEGNEAGSVRRYRLALSEEKDCSRASVEEGRKRPANGILRRWTCSFRRSS